MKKLGILLILSMTVVYPFPVESEPGSSRVRAAKNLCAAVSPGHVEPYVNEKFAVLFVTERGQGIDLNGDSDLYDVVPHIYDFDTGEMINLGLDSTVRTSPQLEGDFLVFAVSESSQGSRDLNEDTDIFDEVAHLYDHRSRTVTNLRLPVGGWATSVHFHGDRISINVHEGGAQEDLNGDGDRNDSVLHLYDISTGSVVNTGISCRTQYPGGSVFFQVWEPDEGITDLNGDGDSRDFVLHRLRADNTTQNLQTVASQVGVSESLVAFGVWEPNQGNRDLNGDGDTFDFVPHAYDPIRDAMAPLELGSLSQIFLHEETAIFVCLEGLARDDNGDGDALDTVPFVYDSRTETTRSLNLASTNVASSRGLTAMLIREASQGRTDLNRDGDIQDLVLHFYSKETGTAINTEIEAVPPFQTNGEVVAFGRSESDLAEDLNRDGDLSDRVLHFYRPDSSTVVNLGLALAPITQLYFSSEIMFFEVDEASQGRQDLNQDGDWEDEVAFIYDFASGRTTNLELSSGSKPGLDGRVVLFQVGEAREGKDLNGDGDQCDLVTHVIDLFPCTRGGSVNSGAGSPVNVLYLNGLAGEGRDRVVDYNVLDPFRLEMRKPPSLGENETASYAAYLWLGRPTRGTTRFLPFGLGGSCMPMPATGGVPQPTLIWNNAARNAWLGQPNRPSRAAPDVFVQRSLLRRAATFFVQGLIYDPGSASPVKASVTNGILARPVFGGR